VSLVEPFRGHPSASITCHLCWAITAALSCAGPHASLATTATATSGGPGSGATQVVPIRTESIPLTATSASAVETHASVQPTPEKGASTRASPAEFSDPSIGNFRALCGDFPPAPQYVDENHVSLPSSTRPPAKSDNKAIAVGFNTWTKRNTQAQSSVSSLGVPASGDFYGIFTIDAVSLRQIVFHSGTGEPHQCCVGMVDEAVALECRFSGADEMIGRGSVSLVNGDLKLRWCTALAHSREVLDKGERSFHVPPKSHLRLLAPHGACSPKTPISSL
jgi:hypothetical protein